MLNPEPFAYEEEKAQEKRKNSSESDDQVRRLHIARCSTHKHLEIQQRVGYHVLIGRLRLRLLRLHALSEAFAGVRVDIPRIGGIFGAFRNDAACCSLCCGVHDWDAAIPTLRERERESTSQRLC